MLDQRRKSPFIRTLGSENNLINGREFYTARRRVELNCFLMVLNLQIPIYARDRTLHSCRFGVRQNLGGSRWVYIRIGLVYMYRRLEAMPDRFPI